MQLIRLLITVAFAGIVHGGAAAAAPEPAASAAIRALVKEGKLDQAFALAQQAIKASPGDADMQLAMGRVLYAQKKFPAAHEHFSRAIELRPDFARAYFFRGMAAGDGGRSVQALADLGKASELEPGNADHWFELGREYVRAKKQDQARLAYEKAAVADPGKPHVWFALGNSASASEDHAKAVDFWTKTLALDPAHSGAHYNLGQHHQLRGEASEQLKHFTAAQTLDPKDIDISKKLLQSYYRTGQFDSAASTRTQLLQLIAQSPAEEVRNTSEICFDQFDVPEDRFFVYETLKSKGWVRYHYTFRLFDAKGKFVRSINLETSPGLDENGGGYVLGMDEGKVHSNFGIMDKLPPYPELKKLVLDVNANRLSPAATTTRK